MVIKDYQSTFPLLPSDSFILIMIVTHGYGGMDTGNFKHRHLLAHGLSQLNVLGDP